jgi:hypothetical protein
MLGDLQRQLRLEAAFAQYNKGGKRRNLLILQSDSIVGGKVCLNQ